MTSSRLFKALISAPVIAVLSILFGLALSTLLIMTNGLIHLIGGFEHGQISCLVTFIAKYVPVVFSAFGFLSAFTTREQFGTVFGSARWANGKDLQKLSAPETGLLIGRDPMTNTLLRYAGPAHLLTMAPTRTGKGVGTIIPNLLTAQRSVICIDPKGENAKITLRARQRFGPVHILDPFAVTGRRSSALNPLDMLDPAGSDLSEDANTLADALVFDEPGMSGDAHWNEEAKALIAGLILNIVVVEAPDRRHLGTLRDHLTLAPERFVTLLKKMQDTDGADGLIARAANRHLGKSDREATGVLSAAQRHTHFLDSARMSAVLKRSDFRFGDLKNHIATVFLVLPPDRLSTYSRWLRLLITQSLTDMARSSSELSQSSQPVLYLLDEFAALGHLDPVARAMGLMAGYGVQLWPILQDVHQLRALYGKRAGTFFSNAAVLQLFGVNDIETAELIARTIGKTDTRYTTQSWSEGKTSSSEHVSGRDLINADEIMRLPPDTMILLRQGQRPACVRKLRYYVDPEFRGDFDAP
ncbi:type IV secretory system conjugative DNA transfer family protein [Agrobacterium sp. rho-8.1]|nr:type IV secretory system conjugative DNA transfer family protein [Agrobacterium sp. rho-8.1]